MSDLTEFLGERLADDELEAGNCHVLGCMLFTSFDEGWCDCPAPARVLAEVTAKRAIIELHGPLYERLWEGDDTPLVCRTCEDRSRHDAERWPCRSLRFLALPHAGHLDYREDWRP